MFNLEVKERFNLDEHIATGMCTRYFLSLYMIVN